MDDAVRPIPVQVPGTFAVFYRDTYSSVVALTWALSGNRWTAEDLAQEAFARAHRDWDSVEKMDSPKAWVRRVAINLARSRFRRIRYETATLVRLRGQVGGADTFEPRDQAFWDELRRLPKRQAQALALRYVDDLSVAQIAEIMEAAEGTVRALLHQGRTRLERQLIAKGWIEQ